MNGEYFLQYQIVVHDTIYQPRAVVGSAVIDEKAYYYLVGFADFKEYGTIVQRPMSVEHLTAYAKRKEVYWMNKDSSVVKLDLIAAP